MEEDLKVFFRALEDRFVYKAREKGDSYKEMDNEFLFGLLTEEFKEFIDEYSHQYRDAKIELLDIGLACVFLYMSLQHHGYKDIPRR